MNNQNTNEEMNKSTVKPDVAPLTNKAGIKSLVAESPRNFQKKYIGRAAPIMAANK